MTKTKNNDTNMTKQYKEYQNLVISLMSWN